MIIGLYFLSKIAYMSLRTIMPSSPCTLKLKFGMNVARLFLTTIYKIQMFKYFKYFFLKFYSVLKRNIALNFHFRGMSKSMEPFLSKYQKTKNPSD